MNIDKKTKNSYRWQTVQSIFLEMDTLFLIISKPKMHKNLTTEINDLIKSIGNDWLNSWNSLWDKKEDSMYILENGARLAGVLLSNQYEKSSLEIRELSLEDLFRINQIDNNYAGNNSQQPDLNTIMDQIVLKRSERYQKFGFKLNEEDYRYNRIKNEILQAFRIIPGGDLHTRFWMVMDRFYYEYYQPWRAANASSYDLLEQFASNALKNSQSEINLDWLPAQNPLLRLPELNRAVLEGDLTVIFWVEPFGMSDSWLLEEKYVLVSFAEFGTLFKNFQKFALDLSKCANALGDPTRLIILRLIRDFGMVNTEIAAFLGISRPTVSVHAKILREAGFIYSRQEGRTVRHKLNPSALHLFFHELKEFLDFE